jgi:hypothetical protein
MSNTSGRPSKRNKNFNTTTKNRAASSNVQKVFEIKFGWDSTMSFG